MASNTNAVVNFSMTATQQGTNAFAAGPFWTGAVSYAQAFASGSGAGQCDLCYMANRTVTTGATDSIDLNGALTDALGVTISTIHLVALFIENINSTGGAANTTTLTLGGGANPFVGFLGGTTPTIGPLQPGACLFLCSPAAAGLGTVTAGTADILSIVNSAGASNTYQIGILGRSA